MYSQEKEWLLVEKYQGQKSEAFLADVAKLEAGVPLAYLIGHIPFLNSTIHLDSHPLIPRPETEFWVDKVIKIISELNSPVYVLDLCAGSGAIGVAVAKGIQNSLVDFIELDANHLPTIAKNCRENQIDSERVNILEGDLFKLKTDKKLPEYNFILTNPPYIDKTLGRTDKSVIENEPALALYGGRDGIELIEEIIKKAPLHLKPGGQLWIEHEPEQSESIKNLAANKFVTTTHKDQYSVERVSQLVLQ
jgi:release factor glutamine methyltransferase